MILLITDISRVFSDFSTSEWFSDFLCPVSAYTTLEITVLVILALRIPVRLVQRLVRGCPDPPGLGAWHPLCVWTETGEALQASDRHAHDPASSLCRGTLCTTSNYRCTPEIHIKLLTFCCTLFYAAYHVQHDCNLSSVLLRSSCLLLF